ncbi:MAG: DUF87 domain-containing protein [Candidatus Freyarchaeum deiterrae]
MEGLEKLGVFYLGKEYDLEEKKIIDRPVMYDARDLTTHAVCVGMTGSGKTGLCIALLEEAAIDSVPAIIIDPKGDITNLLLNFPELRPEDFQPWINMDDARRKGMSVEEYSKKVATDWRNGLAEWGEGPERIQRLKDSAEFLIYTPGSDTGLPVNILHSFDAPELDWEENKELLREKIQGTVSAILGLVGIEADPVRSREHILLSNIFEYAWRKGENLDIAKLITMVQNPPMRKLGVFQMDTFYPEKERFELAIALNNLLAAPGFERWLEGQPLDIGKILYGPSGKPRMAIFYTAHLNDAERMFFVTLLLQQVLTWVRSQPGTTSLRALVYFDEVFGYFPPVGEPPSKRPLLTLLKQARAFGLGLVLTTQNPVDLDYKGLTNAGTWFIGKLQTERDKARVLEGVESVVSASGTTLDRNYLDKLISSLGSRVFLLHNINEEKPIVFQTRWAMSYLRGPLTRSQIKQLMKNIKEQEGIPSIPSTPEVKIKARAAAPSSREELPAGLSSQPPALAPGIEQVFLPALLSLEQAVLQLKKREGSSLNMKGDRLIYEPALLGMADINFIDRKYNFSESRKVTLLLEVPESQGLLKWEEAESLNISPKKLANKPLGEALFSEVPASVSDASKLKILAKDFTDYLYRNQAVVLYYNPSLNLYSKPNEAQGEFTVRCREVAREKRDSEVDTMSDQYKRMTDKLQGQMTLKKRKLAKVKSEYDTRKREEFFATGDAVIELIKGRRSQALSTISRKKQVTGQVKAKVQDSKDTISDLQDDIAKLQAELNKKIEGITRSWDNVLKDIQEIRITPRKTDIGVELFALAWAPKWEITYKDANGRERTDDIHAYTAP